MSVPARMFTRKLHLAKSLNHLGVAKKRTLYDEDSWRVFRIMSEFVDGFEIMSEVGTAVTIFGSARMTQDSPYYKLARDIAYKLAKAKYTVITGGGPGIMEAANRGASEAGGHSVGLNIVLPQEQSINAYVNVPVGFRYFFVRKVMFVKYASAVVIMPGGLGTMDELFEALTLIQTEKVRPFPVILVGKKYWQGLLDWIDCCMIKEGMLPKDDMKMLKVMDDADQIVREIKRSTRPRRQTKVNF